MRVVIILLCSFLVIDVCRAISEKQMAAAKKLIRNTCQTKTKISNEVIEAMHKGDFSERQCYMLCIMNTYKLFTPDGLFDFDGSIKILKANAPDSIADSATISITNCKDAMKTFDDKCVGAAEIAKCVYDDNPENYFLP
ncbi:hypothetical protein JTB14_013950 [Gonioctena quinquepunctata]|nr:hypothetical protein JTB14_013950 [Gonioctena quinquepunctata]